MSVGIDEALGAFGWDGSAEIDLDPNQQQLEGFVYKPPDHAYGSLVRRTMGRLAAWTDDVPAAQRIMNQIALGAAMYCYALGIQPEQIDVSVTLTEHGRIVATVYRK